MRSILVLCFAIWLMIAVTSCSKRPTPISPISEQTTKVLNAASQRLDMNTLTLLFKLKRKRNDPSTSYKAGIWLANATNVDSLRQVMFKQLNAVKIKPRVDTAEFFRKFSILIDSLKKVEELISKEFSKNIEQLDANTKTQLLTLQGNPSLSLTETEFTIATMKLQISTLANQIVIFCDEQVSTDAFIIPIYSLLVQKNATVVKPGETIEFVAGVGSFSRHSQEIKINGNSIKAGEDGIVRYSLKAPLYEGRFSIPVTADFFDEAGEMQHFKTSVIYNIKK